MNKLTTSPLSSPDTITLTLSEKETPTAYKRALQDYVDSGLTVEDAKRAIEDGIELEFIYEPGAGLFLVESTAVEAGGLHSPYTLTEIIEDES